MSETILMIESSHVKVSHPNHGIFTCDSHFLGHMISSVTGDVNYSRKSLAAIVTDAVGISYFDCDTFTLCAVAVELGTTAATMSKHLANISEERVVAIYNQFHPGD